MSTIVRVSDLEKEYPHFKPVESSLCRKIRDIVCKILCDFWNSAISYFRKVNNYEDCPLINGAVSELNQMRCLGILTMNACGKLLEKENDDVLYIGDGLHTNLSDFVFPKNIEQKRICIPFVLKGRIRNHVVAIYIDLTANKVEYYDPKGLTINDRNDPRLNQLLKRVWEKFGDYTLVENTQKHQYDCHNCGVYVLSYFYRRQIETPKEIFATSTDVWHARKDLILKLYYDQGM